MVLTYLATGSRAWAEAGAEHLPFEDDSFDVVMSSIGAMFAPHHQQVADELVRVCRPAGTIGLLSWTPEGSLGELFRTMGPYAPRRRPAPRRRRCGARRTTSPSCSATAWPSAPWSATSSTSRRSRRRRRSGEHFTQRYGPTIATRANAAKDGREGELDDALARFAEQANRGSEGDARFEFEYLVAVGRSA